MQRGSQGIPRAEQKASQKTKEGDMQASSIGPQSDTSDVTRPKTAFTRKKPSIRERFRPQSATPSHSSGSVKRKEAESIGAEEHHTNNRALENEHFEREKEKADWEKREFNESKTEWKNYCEKLKEKHTKETEELHKAIKRLTVEKDNLLTRLSTIASDRLTHENVNIADLSDADRPTKLQEQYSELYDNEWTDAFEELTKHGNATEYDAIIILLKILMSSFQNCREITWGRYERLQHVASYIEQEISLQSPKVISNASKPVLTTQEAESSRAQLDKNDERMDQSAANGKVEMEDPSTIKASEDEIAKEKGKTSDTDKNVDKMQEQTASGENGKNKGMQIVKGFIVKSVQSGDPNVSEASKDKSESKEGKKDAKDSVESSDPNKYAEESVQSGDPNVSEASKDESENEKGKKHAEESVQSCDQNVSEASKDESENEKGKIHAKKSVQSCDPNVSEASKDESENGKGKKDAKDSVESSNPNVSEASSKDKSVNTTGKKSVQSGDPNVREASKEKSETGKGKNNGKENVMSGDPNVIGASKDKSENNGAKENLESGDPIVSETSKDKLEKKTGKHLKCKIDLNFELTHDIKVIWRKTTLELKGIAAMPLYSLIETCLDMPFTVLPFTSKYLKRCFDLCWKMGFQETPLHLDGVAELDAYAGKKFDKDKFRAYTRSGSHIAFVVWPTLYQYEGGPILVKGIVQCYSPVAATNEKHS